MPRKAHFTREEIADAVLRIVSKQGPEHVTARNIGKLLGSSASPIFTLFDSMDEVLDAARQLGRKRFDDLMSDIMDYRPAFKEFGMRMVRFARTEQNLFTFIMLNGASLSDAMSANVSKCLTDMESLYGLSAEQTHLIFRQMWTFTCGLSLLSAQTPEEYPEELISEMLSCNFASLMIMIKSGRKPMAIEPKPASERVEMPTPEWDRVNNAETAPTKEAGTHTPSQEDSAQ